MTKGAIHKGSLVWHLSKLKEGQSLLLSADVGKMPHIELTIRRAVSTGALSDCYKVKTCIGHTFDMMELPFKFFKITRVELP